MSEFLKKILKVIAIIFSAIIAIISIQYDSCVFYYRWKEQGILSDKEPLFAIHNLSATDVTKYRADLLDNKDIKSSYLAEYESIAGTQNFLNAISNYPLLKGQQTNLYKCFIPQGFDYTNTLYHNV